MRDCFRAVWATLFAAALVSCSDDGTGPAKTDTTPSSYTDTISTWAGTGFASWDGDANHVSESSFYWVIDIEFTPTLGTYIIDYNNHRVREVLAGDTLMTVIGTNIIGDGPPDESDQVWPGALGTLCALNHPTRLTELRYGPHAGKILLTSWHNHKLRLYDPATELVFVYVGRGAGYEGDGQDATEFGRLNQVQQALEGKDGSIYILDQRNHVFRKIDPNNIMSTVAGIHVPSDQEGGYNGDGLAPMATLFNFDTGANPQPSGGFILDDDDNLYVADTKNHIIRKIDWSANTVTIVAGTPGVPGYANGAAKSAKLNWPLDLEWGPDGRLYVADELNHAVRAIDLSTGTVTTVAGNGTFGYSGDGGSARSAQLYAPRGIAFDPQGNLYIADTDNHCIRRVLMP
jgi:hypothetical protein